MKGILKLAYKLLVNDKAKFKALLLGITFAVFLAMFARLLFDRRFHRSNSRERFGWRAPG
jgi:putative ABC transport system permease protein